MDSPAPAIRIAALRKAYPGAVAVDGVSLDIARGSFVALVGASGSGKSTLLKAINRLVEPDAGSIALDGVFVGDVPLHVARRRFGYVFQNIGLFPHLSVAENIAVGLRIAGRPAPAERIAALLALVDLPADIAARMPDALSGGQRQRVGVARALAPEPQILLMDEPFGALDPVTRDGLGRRVRALHDRLGLTTIMVTHDMAEALILTDRVLVMDAGRIVADAAPADLMTVDHGSIVDSLLAVPREQARALAALGGR